MKSEIKCLNIHSVPGKNNDFTYYPHIILIQNKDVTRISKTLHVTQQYLTAVFSLQNRLLHHLFSLETFGLNRSLTPDDTKL